MLSYASRNLPRAWAQTGFSTSSKEIQLTTIGSNEFGLTSSQDSESFGVIRVRPMFIGLGKKLATLFARVLIKTVQPAVLRGET